MLFNSFEFLLFFLPTTLALFFLSARYFGNEAAIGLLVLCSLGFYSWWNPIYLLLILFSMAFNFQVGKRLGQRSHKGLLAFGITVNLGLLAYYKYANFFVSNVSSLLATHWSLGDILLPLAISFFTFQQIAYLVDSHRGILPETESFRDRLEYFCHWIVQENGIGRWDCFLRQPGIQCRRQRADCRFFYCLGRRAGIQLSTLL